MVRQIPPKTQLGVIKSNKNQLGETIAPEIVHPESDGKPIIYYPDGGRFFIPVELSNYAEQEGLLKDQEQLKHQTLIAQLKANGIDITALE